MTRLEQAFRWWENHEDHGDIVAIPGRHFDVLQDAEMIECVACDEALYDLTTKGRVALDRDVATPTPDAEPKENADDPNQA